MIDITFGNIKAGDGNRTHVSSLEGWCSTIELHPHEVGVTGFEPATSWSQTRRSSQAEPHPEGYLFASVSSVTQVVLYYRVRFLSTLFLKFFKYFLLFLQLDRVGHSATFLLRHSANRHMCHPSMLPAHNCHHHCLLMCR